MFRPCGQFSNNIVNKQGVFHGFFSILVVHNTSGWLPSNKTNRQSVTTAHSASSVHSYVFRLYVMAVLQRHAAVCTAYRMCCGDGLRGPVTEKTTRMNSLINWERQWMPYTTKHALAPGVTYCCLLQGLKYPDVSLMTHCLHLIKLELN
jgi:hypothetical protein